MDSHSRQLHSSNFFRFNNNYHQLNELFADISHFEHKNFPTRQLFYATPSNFPPKYYSLKVEKLAPHSKLLSPNTTFWSERRTKKMKATAEQHKRRSYSRRKTFENENSTCGKIFTASSTARFFRSPLLTCHSCQKIDCANERVKEERKLSGSVRFDG